jgi:thioredoxin 1
MRTLLATALLLFATASQGAEPPYVEGADAKADIRASFEQASKANVPVMVVFGANWCRDSQVLATALKTEPTAALIQKNFSVVMVDVGRFDRNVELAESYGVPLKNGIPAVAVLSPQGSVVYATRAGELARARSMGDEAIHDFFANIPVPEK